MSLTTTVAPLKMLEHTCGLWVGGRGHFCRGKRYVGGWLGQVKVRGLSQALGHGGGTSFSSCRGQDPILLKEAEDEEGERVS